MNSAGQVSAIRTGSATMQRSVFGRFDSDAAFDKRFVSTVDQARMDLGMDDGDVQVAETFIETLDVTGRQEQDSRTTAASLANRQFNLSIHSASQAALLEVLTGRSESDREEDAAAASESNNRRKAQLSARLTQENNNAAIRVTPLVGKEVLAF